MINKPMKILLLSPHTDDIELGCGGSLTKWMLEGHFIQVIVFSTCKESLPEGHDNIREFLASMDRIKAESFLFNYPVRRFDEHRQNILDDMLHFKPDLVISPSRGDIHQDHRVIYEEALRAYKCNHITYEPYSGEFNPKFYIPLTEELVSEKLALLNLYQSQKVKGKKYLADDVIKGRASVRGSEIDVDYSEAYEVVRWIL
jgi:N-acetylglucosamine malate deacetylase 1